MDFLDDALNRALAVLNGSTASPTGALWHDVPFFPGIALTAGTSIDAIIFSNSLAMCVNAATPASADYTMTAPITFLGSVVSGMRAGLALRVVFVNGVSCSGYSADFEVSGVTGSTLNGNWVFKKFTNSGSSIVETPISTVSASLTLGTTYTLAFSVTGSTFNVLVNNSAVISSVNDTTYSAAGSGGVIGFGANNTTDGPFIGEITGGPNSSPSLNGGSVSASDVRFTDMDLTGTAPFGGTSPYTTILEYSSNGGSSWTTAPGFTGFPYTLSGLVRGTAYQIRQTVTDSATPTPATAHSAILNVTTFVYQFVTDGDSIDVTPSGANSWPNQSAVALNPMGIKVYSCGVGGSTSTDAVNRFNNSGEPGAVINSGALKKILVIYTGTNDFDTSGSAATWASNLQTYIGLAKTAGYDVVIGATVAVNPTMFASGTIMTQVNLANSNIRTNAHAWGFYDIVELAAQQWFYNLQTQTINSQYSSDGTHPVTQGAAALAGCFSQPLLAYLFPRSTPGGGGMLNALRSQLITGGLHA
jgi:GDSL-like Lipase/Acylhydrolase family